MVFGCVSSTVQQMVEAYIEEKFSKISKEIEHQTKLVQYDYQIQSLKITYYQHHPNAYQVGFLE